MSNPYVGEIKMFAGNFAPNGWAFCDGQLIPISENETLFNLIGTTYGGDGQSTFALPDLRSRVPVHMGTGASSYIIGQSGGVETVTLTSSQIPAHNHAVVGSGNLASRNTPTDSVLATTQASTITPYGTDAPVVALSPTAVTSAGGSQPHENRQPFVVVNFIISLFGVYPSPT